MRLRGSPHGPGPRPARPRSTTLGSSPTALLLDRPCLQVQSPRPSPSRKRARLGASRRPRRAVRRQTRRRCLQGVHRAGRLPPSRVGGRPEVAPRTRELPRARSGTRPGSSILVQHRQGNWSVRKSVAVGKHWRESVGGPGPNLPRTPGASRSLRVCGTLSRAQIRAGGPQRATSRRTR